MENKIPESWTEINDKSLKLMTLPIEAGDILCVVIIADVNLNMVIMGNHDGVLLTR